MSNKKVVFGASAGIAAIVGTMLSGIYEREGGYVNHKQDRGGETNYGVTKSVALDAGYKGDMRVFPKECVTEHSVCADKVYYNSYIKYLAPILKIDPVVGDELFDTGVNMGPAWPGKYLQEALNEVCTITPKLKVDGKIGNGTATRFSQCQATVGKVTFCKTMLDKLDAKQKDRYDGIVRRNPSQRVFYKGWINHRIGNVDRKRCAA